MSGLLVAHNAPRLSVLGIFARQMWTAVSSRGHVACALVFDHVTIRVDDRAASERFYDAVLTPLGIDRTYSTGTFSEWRDFSLTVADARNPATRRLHIGFVAPTRDQVDDFWRTGTEAGYASDGPPGPRPEYGSDYYGAFLLDPDANSAEAVFHDTLRRGGIVDHLWLRVADVEAAKRFYETIAPSAGLRLRHDLPDRAQFNGESGSFSVVAGPSPTEHLHMAFPAGDDALVRSFHEAAVAAGYRDHGPPGERPQYHPGYYAAYVLDPDGNNIELVNHHRA
jgi:catechol 2,3-dioxygenase-like lactoylglutathione lyase family enzyme